MLSLGNVEPIKAVKVAIFNLRQQLLGWRSQVLSTPFNRASKQLSTTSGSKPYFSDVFSVMKESYVALFKGDPGSVHGTANPRSQYDCTTRRQGWRPAYSRM